LTPIAVSGSERLGKLTGEADALAMGGKTKVYNPKKISVHGLSECRDCYVSKILRSRTMKELIAETWTTVSIGLKCLFGILLSIMHRLATDADCRLHGSLHASPLRQNLRYIALKAS
jgi:tRNA A37 threonylcarbamoyladenosine dehydratase